MKRVFASQDQAAIAIVSELLADEGIHAILQNENTFTVLGEVPFTLAMPELWVTNDEDEARALEVVARFDSGEAKPRDGGQKWTCPNCGETIEGQFTACWNCGAEAGKT